MTTHEERQQVVVLLNESITAGARLTKVISEEDFTHSG